MTTEPRPSRRASSRLTTPWALLAGATAAWGVFAAVRFLPWQSLVAVAFAAGLLGASLALSGDAVTTEQIDLRRAMIRGALTALGAVVLVGLASVAGIWGAGLLALVLLTWPGLAGRVLAKVSRWRDHEAAEQPAQERAEVTDRDDARNRVVPGSVAEPGTTRARDRVRVDEGLDPAPEWSATLDVPTHLSDRDLCLAWESSSRALRRARNPEERLEVVRIRQACLDELERRRPDAVRAWVLSGADPDSSPAPYLRR